MTDLTALAYKAGFTNLHDMASWGACLIGSILTDEFEMIYFLLGDYKEHQTVDIFGVREQSNPETCALYRFERNDLERSVGLGNERHSPGRGGINLSKRDPLHTGQTAIAVLEAYANAEETPPAYTYWMRRTQQE